MEWLFTRKRNEGLTSLPDFISTRIHIVRPHDISEGVLDARPPAIALRISTGS
jgi:hypothetical protein